MLSAICDVHASIIQIELFWRLLCVRDEILICNYVLPMLYIFLSGTTENNFRTRSAMPSNLYRTWKHLDDIGFVIFYRCDLRKVL